MALFRILKSSSSTSSNLSSQLVLLEAGNHHQNEDATGPSNPPLLTRDPVGFGGSLQNGTVFPLTPPSSILAKLDTWRNGTLVSFTPPPPPPPTPEQNGLWVPWQNGALLSNNLGIWENGRVASRTSKLSTSVQLGVRASNQNSAVVSSTTPAPAPAPQAIKVEVEDLGQNGTMVSFPVCDQPPLPAGAEILQNGAQNVPIATLQEDPDPLGIKCPNRKRRPHYSPLYEKDPDDPKLTHAQSQQIRRAIRLRKYRVSIARKMQEIQEENEALKKTVPISPPAVIMVSVATDTSDLEDFIVTQIKQQDYFESMSDAELDAMLEAEGLGAALFNFTTARL